jgi:hypothetical protein
LDGASDLFFRERERINQHRVARPNDAAIGADFASQEEVREDGEIDADEAPVFEVVEDADAELLEARGHALPPSRRRRRAVGLPSIEIGDERPPHTSLPGRSWA